MAAIIYANYSSDNQHEESIKGQILATDIAVKYYIFIVSPDHYSIAECTHCHFTVDVLAYLTRL